jgi:hypothetical protein
MASYLHISLLAGVTALGATWCLQPAVPGAVHATELSPLADSDGDFLPDQVEWAVLTSATSADTDNDFVPDFVEVVQRGSPRQPNAPMSLDHEMRVVVSAPVVGAADQTAWLHIFVRYVEAAVPVDGFGVWFETPWLPGLRIPLEGILLMAPTIETRVTAVDGAWLRVSAPLVSLDLLYQLLPCSIQCEGSLEGRYLRTGVNLFDVQGSVATIVPFGEETFAIQTIGVSVATGTQSNKVCVLDLCEVGSGPGGTVFEVADAGCEDCNELECGTSCAQTVGWILTIPGGTAVLTGN